MWAGSSHARKTDSVGTSDEVSMVTLGDVLASLTAALILSAAEMSDRVVVVGVVGSSVRVAESDGSEAGIGVATDGTISEGPSIDTVGDSD